MRRLTNVILVAHGGPQGDADPEIEAVNSAQRNSEEGGVASLLRFLGMRLARS
jgi:hypothetical protein